LIYLSTRTKKRNNYFTNQHATNANTKTDKAPETEVKKKKRRWLNLANLLPNGVVAGLAADRRVTAQP